MILDKVNMEKKGVSLVPRLVGTRRKTYGQ
jgi:hypothetical protein